MKSDIEIARSIELKKIKQVAESIGIPREEVENYGRYIAKIPEQLIDEEKVKKSNLILVLPLQQQKRVSAKPLYLSVSLWDSIKLERKLSLLYVNPLSDPVSV